jgi:signal transduction histidine kinase
MRNISSAKKRLILLAGFLLAFLFVFNLSTVLLYRRAKSYLDDELGERLRSIAVSISHYVEFSSPGELTPDAISAPLYTVLHTSKAENYLSNIVIVEPGGYTVVDLANLSEPGEPNPFIELDFSAVTLARAGIASYTSLYRTGDDFMKSAYAPITNDNNEIIGIVGVEAGAVFFDVLKELRRAIVLVDVSSILLILIIAVIFYRQSLSLDRAQEAVLKGENLAAMGRMVAGVAHEIRNPLSIIKTSAERLRKKHGISDEALTYISEEVDELNRILTGYLDFARSEDSTAGDVSMNKIIKRCLLILDPEFEGRCIAPEIALPAEEVVVHGNDKRLQQALLNVLLNALQAVETRGKIEISLVKRENQAEILIRDNGCGIDSKDLKEITKPFFTRKAQGSGLGLSIVSSIVDEHGGSLRIASELGEGTSVSISIPMQRNAGEVATKGKV